MTANESDESEGRVGGMPTPASADEPTLAMGSIPDRPSERCDCGAPRCEREGCQDKPTSEREVNDLMAVAYAQGRDDILTAVASTPFEFVQDDENERRCVARVLDSDRRLVCETTPEDAALIVRAVNFFTVARDEWGWFR